MKIEFLKLGYDLVQSTEKESFELHRNGVKVVQGLSETDFQHYLDIIDNKHDLTLEIMFFNPSALPVVETDFYKWMIKKEKNNFHRINDVIEYLSECFGFIKGCHKIQGDVIRTLKNIGCFYFDNEIKHKLKGVK